MFFLVNLHGKYYYQILLMKKRFTDYFKITLKGMAMGAADVVPGVSGGTIAFISGIYEELIESINGVNFNVLKVWKDQGFSKAWKTINGNFLLALLTGIAVSIISLAKVITHLLQNHPISVWSFFFGLVVASIFIIGKQITSKSLTTFLFFVFGACVSYYITVATPSAMPDHWSYLFISGFIAIIAMILPGVSGAFILLLMGTYEIILGTINQTRESILTWDFGLLSHAIQKILIFGIGAILGLKLFSKILHWMFAHHKNKTLAILCGFMLGSLNKVWPWKNTISTRVNSHQEEVPFLQKSVWPAEFESEPMIYTALILMVIGILTIGIIEFLATKKQV
jgi:putative membrane protein